MKKIILTCEHGGAEIPAPYKKLFKHNMGVLKTHRGLDIGALAVAKDLKNELNSPLIYSVVTRLLVDLNRFLGSLTLFSEFSNILSRAEKDKIIAQYYKPHWIRVHRVVESLITKKNTVIHIAVHSMTDNLNGNIRTMQLALLYDPKRTVEKKFSSLWIAELRKEFPDFKIARNNPYKGDGEGLTSTFRTLFKPNSYLGIEIEINQGYLNAIKNKKSRILFSHRLSRSLRRAMTRLN